MPTDTAVLDAARLRVFREVVRRGSLSAAAEALSFTQPAVSRQIAALEREGGPRAGPALGARRGAGPPPARRRAPAPRARARGRPAAPRPPPPGPPPHRGRAPPPRPRRGDPRPHGDGAGSGRVRREPHRRAP